MGVPAHPSEVRGWIAPALRVVLRVLTLPSTLILSPPRLPPHVTPADHLARSARRAMRVDTFIAGCLLVDIACLWYVAEGPADWRRAFAVGFVGWRVVDVLATVLRVCLFDEFDSRTHLYVHSSPTRVVVLGLVNYLELVVCFAGVYAFAPQLVVAAHAAPPVFDGPAGKGLHLSFATQLTVGYGDAYPVGWLRPVAWLQALAGLGLIALQIARYMAVVPPPHPDPADLPPPPTPPR
ncbi:MAG: potassium channel family protein [Gemmataceae bacterium]|nr:potassium channel family protein [Gemmataceae bacterium]